MKELTIQNKSDNIGIFASTLCMIHCLATPFLFIVHTNATKHNETIPFWWGWIDVFFLIISLFSVYHSADRTSNIWVKNTLWVSWIALSIAIINEKLAFIHLPEILTYIIASLLVITHLYNHKYCQCHITKPSKKDE